MAPDVGQIFFHTSNNQRKQQIVSSTTDVPSKSLFKRLSGGVDASRERWQDNANFPSAEQKKVGDVLRRLKKGPVLIHFFTRVQ